MCFHDKASSIIFMRRLFLFIELMRRRRLEQCVDFVVAKFLSIKMHVMGV